MTAVDYFQSYENYFWAWEENGDVLAIPNGSTIIYTEEIIPLLRELAENGLPVFGSVLLAIIAINPNNNNALESALDIYQKGRTTQKIIESDGYKFLKVLQSLPQEFREGRRRNLVLQTIFENSHNRNNVSSSRGIVGYLKNGKGRGKSQQQKPLPDRIKYKDFYTFDLLFRRYPHVNALIKALQDLPIMEEEKLPDFEDATTSDIHYEDFVEALMSHSQTFQVGALIKPIWAGFKIPIFNAHPSEQPLGGVSDLANKGNFDRLLVSEFANDDLVFMSRIANNEALYLHREMPPVSDKLQRIMLVDVSIKAWGIPKILAHACSLAIAKHPKSKTESVAFAVGKQHHQLNYATIGGVVDGLQLVSINLNSSAGVHDFLKAYNHNKQLEIFYFTTDEALKYAEIQKLLSENAGIFKYIITTNAAGEISFYRNKNKAFKHLQTIKLPLKQLWTAPKRTYEIKSKIVTSPGLSYPILYPIPVDIKRVLPVGNERYFVSHGCLFRHNRVDATIKGCELIMENLPKSGVFEIGKASNGHLYFIAFNPQKRTIGITDLITFDTMNTFFHEWKAGPYTEFIYLNQQFVYLNKNSEAHTFTPNFETKTVVIEKVAFDRSVFEMESQDRQEESEKEPNFGYRFNVLKKVTSICIDAESRLIFNSHKLQYGETVFFSLANMITLAKLAEANYSSEKKAFVFPDESEIKVSQHGLIILRSSNNKIPTIYISPTIDNMVGMATEKHFAGYDYFYKLPYVNFNLVNCGIDKLTCTKILRKYTEFGLSEAKKIIDNAPTSFSLNMKLDQAEKMVLELENNGCKLTFSSNSTENQEFISTKLFSEKYIQEFISQILKYGAIT